eukprot:scaffold2300_cov138-Isochrysis_galbana.AAC.1
MQLAFTTLVQPRTRRCAHAPARHSVRSTSSMLLYIANPSLEHSRARTGRAGADVDGAKKKLQE